jgi:hypothetical protein
MSCDYMFFKLKRPVSSHKEIDESVVLPMGTLDDLKRHLSSVFSAIIWRTDRQMSEILNSPGGATKDIPVPSSNVLVRGNLENNGTWYEFSFSAQPDGDLLTFAVRTSRDSNQDFIEKLCRATGYVAFDRQNLKLLGHAGTPRRIHRTSQKGHACLV